MTQDESLLLNSAVWYAGLGWKLFPVHGITAEGRCTCRTTHAEIKDIGKHPANNNGQTGSTSDPETIKRWWHIEPRYNIGVHCKNSGFFVIDVDPRNGGDISFEKFEQSLGIKLPPTLESTTGTYSMGGVVSKGRHIYFKCDPSEEFPANLDALGFKGIDIKYNGYVLIAPSNHYSGTKYEWVNGHRPDQIEIAEAPEELLTLIRKKNQKRKGTSLGATDWGSVFDGVTFSGKKLDVEQMLKDGLVEGERAIKIYQIACALANKIGVKDESGALAVESLMMRFNYEKVVPPMPLEGQNSLLMHTRRAIEFVRANPISDYLFPNGTSFEKESAWIDSTKPINSVITITDLPEKSNKDLEVSFPKEVGKYEFDNNPLSKIRESISAGETMAQSLSNRNLEIAPDQDSIYEEDGGTIGKRSLTDIGNGRRLVDVFTPVLRYTEGLGWFFWRGTHWKPDTEKLDVKELAKKLGSVIASETKHYDDDDGDKIIKVARWANESKSNSRLNAAIESATSDSRVRIGVEDWDKSPDLLGVNNGVVDLRTGKLIVNSPDLYITRSCPVDYIEGQTNTRWKEFLNFATGGDVEFQNWLQKAAGYTITGRKSYDIMFLVYGPAGTGKNTFVEALVKCLGTKQYAWPLDTSVLSQGDGRATPQDQYHWAELRGRRMVWMDELPDSERLKENSVKRLTGSSEINGRSPGERPFSFTSQAKLWVSTNHRPIITDDAMWRRIRPIPFTHVPEKLDPDLKDYIFDEDGALPAVLAWAVEGAVKLLNSSSNDALGWCSVVQKAAEMYRKNEDRIGIFLEEELRENPSATLGMRDIFFMYRLWSEQRGERPLTQIAFDRKLRDRNIEITGSGSRAVVTGWMLPPSIVGANTMPDLGMLSRMV